MKLHDAQVIARRVEKQLRPYCDRIAIAGSIRREKPEVGDIEIVAIPKSIPGGLFGDEPEVSPEFCKAVNEWKKIKGEPTGRYTQRELPDGIQLDLFIVSHANWGLLYAIRTGSANWVHKRLAARWVQLGYVSVGGLLHKRKNGELVPCNLAEEEDVFKFLGMAYTAPPLREF